MRFLETCEANILTQHIEESASYLSQATTEKFLVAPSPQKLVSRTCAAPAGPAARRMLAWPPEGGESKRVRELRKATVDATPRINDEWVRA